MSGFSTQSATHSSLSGLNEGIAYFMCMHAFVLSVPGSCSTTAFLPSLTCTSYIKPITLPGEEHETWRPCSASRGPSCVFICWANSQPCYWSPSNYTGQATGTCGMVNELQIALRAFPQLVLCIFTPVKFLVVQDSVLYFTVLACILLMLITVMC